MSDGRRIGPFPRPWLAVATVFVAMGLFAAYAFTFTDRFREFVRREVLELIRGSFRGEIGVEHLEGSFWGDLVLTGVSLRYGGAEVLHVPKVRLRYVPWALLRGEIRITDIDLEAPIVGLRRDEQGEWNLAAALSTPPDAPSSPIATPRIVIEALRVAAGEISVLPCRAEASCVLADVAFGARIEVEPAGVDADVGRLSLRLAAEGLPPLWVDGSLRYRGAESPPAAEIRRFMVVTRQSRATLRGKVENLIGLDAARSDLVLTIDALAPSDLSSIASVSAPADWLGGTVRLTGPADDLRAHFELAAGPARAQGDLRVDALAEPVAADGTIEIQDLDLARVATGAEVAGVASGRVQATVRGSNVLLADASASMRIRHARYRQWHLGLVDATANLAKGRASLEGTLRDGASGIVRCNGSADLTGTQQFQFAASLAHFDPKRLDSRLPDGDVTLEARTEGRGFDVATQRSRAIVEVASSRLASLAIDHGRGDLQLADGRLRIEELLLASRDSEVRAAGEVGLSAAAVSQVTVQAKIGDVAPFLGLAGIDDGQGSLTLSGSLRGSANDLATSGSLEAVSFGTNRTWIDRGSVHFDLEGVGRRAPKGRVEATLAGVHAALGLQSASVQLTLSGADRTIAGEAAVQVKDLGGRRHTTRFHASYQPGGLDVRLNELHLAAPPGSFDLEHPAHIALQSGVLTIDDLRVSGTQGTLIAAGQVSRSGPQHLEVTMQGVPLEWLRSFSRETTNVGGVVSTKLDVTGTAASPELAAVLSVADLRVAGQPYAGFRASFGYRTPTATLEARFDQDASHALIASGRAPLDLRWDPEWTHRLTGDVDLSVRSSGLDVAFVNALAPRTLRNATGEITVDLEMHGPLDRPAPRGTVALRGGGATLSPLGVQVSAFTLAAAVAPDAIHITELSAVAREGRLSGGGTISLAGYRPQRLDLRLGLDRWPAIATNRYRSDVSAEISCRGTLDAPEVTGTVEVLRGLLRPDLDFLTRAPAQRDPTIRVVSAGETAAGAAPSPPATAPSSSEASAIYKNTALDVAVTVHRNTWISHADAAVELRGRVRVRKEHAGDLQLTGRIDAAHGWMNFQGRRFQIARGTLTFTGGREIDPSLEVTADYKTSEYLVHVILGGTANAPTLKLESDPSLAQADILSVLMFGKTARELSEGQRVDVGDRATQLAASFAGSEVGQSVGDALGLSGRGIQLRELSASRVALGGYLTDRTFVTVGQTLGVQQGQEFQLEYELTRRWSITSSASSVGGSGADVTWHRRY